MAAEVFDLTDEPGLYCRDTLVFMSAPTGYSAVHRVAKGAVLAVTDSEEEVRAYKVRSVASHATEGYNAPTVYIVRAKEIPYAKWPAELSEKYNAPYGDDS